jgi:hypothetical protein
VNVHNIGIDHPDFKPALMAVLNRNYSRLKRLEGQFVAYRHCFNGDVTLEMLQQSRRLNVEDARKAISAGEDRTPQELKIRLDNNMRIIVPVDEHLKISLSEKSFTLVTKTGVIKSARGIKAVSQPKSRKTIEYREMREYERKRRKEIVMIRQRAEDAPGVSVVSAEPCQDNEGVRCVRLTLSNGHYALMY